MATAFYSKSAKWHDICGFSKALSANNFIVLDLASFTLPPSHVVISIMYMHQQGLLQASLFFCCLLVYVTLDHKKWTLSNTEGKNQDNVGQWCCYCFQFLHPGNYRVRLIPKMKMTPQIEKLINRKKKNYKLNLKQIKLLMKYKESKNKWNGMVFLFRS
ncbi:hypothetical protein EYD10_06116 [Varanus komodoensis]|nr:hypothetical protein EYD10_06116 [Varanus komodoensis]